MTFSGRSEIAAAGFTLALTTAGAPLETFAPTARSDITSRAHVFVPALRQAGGALSAGRLVVGKNGGVPAI